MDSSEWVYAGEGGKHAVFEYVGTKDQWRGKAIRFKKIIRSLSNQIKSDSAGFVQEIVEPLLSPYVDFPEDILVPFMFVRELYENALSSKKVPDDRLGTWDISECDIAKNHQVQAVLLWNYKKIPEEQALSCLSLEIKPKGGYLAVSPLVNPVNRAKYSYSRFTILQELTALGRVKKGWQSKGAFTRSVYNPLDLYSGDLARIHASLERLFALPQNNLKVWFENHELVGLSEKQDHDQDLAKKAATAIFCSMTDNLQSEIVPLLSEILFHESILPALLRLQKLDVVDADGIIMIYNRLVDLCGGDFESVNQILSKKLVLSGCFVHWWTTAEPGTLASPFDFPYCPTVKLLTDEIQQFATQLVNHQLDNEAMDHAHERAISYVAQLSKEACTFFIQN